MSNTQIRAEQARQRRRAILVTIAVLVVLAIAGVTFKNYWDARVRAAHSQGTEVYTPKPYKAAKVAMFIGDSTVAGSGATTSSADFTSIIANTFHWYELNLSKGGAGYHSGNPTLLEQVATLKGYKPSYIIVSAGRNDGFSPEVQANVYDFFSQLRKLYPKVKIVVIAPLATAEPPTDAPSPLPINQLRNSVRSAAYGVGATYLSIGDVLQAKPQLLATNGYDVNNAGHKALAEAAIAAMKSNGIYPSHK